ncbi:MAG: hypothetical protein QF385_13670 [SAR324 cluster bacterium]|nr:hypothetical protein [SAR324 cluster bacterium]
MKIDVSEQCDPEAGSVKLNTTEFVLLFIGEGASEIHFRIIADQWVERNPYPG